MKKSIIICLTLLMSSLPKIALADEPTGLRLLFVDGSDKWFLFVSKPVLTFTDNGLIVTTSDSAFTYTFTDVIEFQFGDSPTNGAKENHLMSPHIVQAKDAVLIYGTDIDSISLFDLSGRRLVAHVQQQSNAVRVNFHSLSSGTYIIRINNQSIKVTKK